MNEKEAREIIGRAKPRLVTVGMDFTEGKAKGYLERLEQEKALIETLKEYLVHEDHCILAFWEGGEPTPDGGYRTRYKGAWYQSAPVDETPECSCGLDKALSQCDEAQK